MTTAIEHVLDLDAIEPIAPPASLELHEAVLHLVQNKYWLDRLAESSSMPLPMAFDSGGYGLHEPATFYEKLFPFVPWWDRISDTVAALVPTDQTIGCSWRWRTKHVKSGERADLVAHLTDRTNALRDCGQRAQYMWIQPLGLVLPHEGKNRVDFLRDCLVEFIPARVTAYDYPAANRMRTHRVEVHGREEVWAVLDERWVQRLEHPEWVQPVLTAYGVKQHLWPTRYPSPEDVAEAFSEPHGQPGFLDKAVVDMEKLEADQADREALVPCAIDDIAALQLAPRFWLSLAVTVLAVGGTWLAVPQDWNDAREIAATAFGVAFGIFLAHTWPIHRAPRSMLKQ